MYDTENTNDKDETFRLDGNILKDSMLNENFARN